MKNKAFLLILMILTISSNVRTQSNRIGFNKKQIFLSGAHIAWVNFGADIGPGETDFAGFKDIFEEARQSGGNCMRLWLHTNGSVTPEFSGHKVVGPGEGPISDLRQILALACPE